MVHRRGCGRDDTTLVAKSCGELLQTTSFPMVPAPVLIHCSAVKLADVPFDRILADEDARTAALSRAHGWVQVRVGVTHCPLASNGKRSSAFVIRMVAASRDALTALSDMAKTVLSTLPEPGVWAVAPFEDEHGVGVMAKFHCRRGMTWSDDKPLCRDVALHDFAGISADDVVAALRAAPFPAALDSARLLAVSAVSWQRAGALARASI